MQYLCQPTYKLLLFLVICMKKKIAIIDYDVGNVKSVQNAIETVGSCSSIITKNPIQIAESDCIILPGVGAFGAAMDALESSGLIQIIFDEVFVYVLVFRYCLKTQKKAIEKDWDGYLVMSFILKKNIIFLFPILDGMK